MQKLDYYQRLENLIEKLLTKEVIAHFTDGLNRPAQQYPFGKINPLLFKSKSNIDLMLKDENYKKIIESLDGDQIYLESNLSNLTTIFRDAPGQSILANHSAIMFYIFHLTLFQSYILARDVLQGEYVTETVENEVENGVIIFQILIEGDGLETERYIKIFSLLNDLSEIVSKIVGEEDEKSEIVILDSGSDTNLGLKSGIETAKSLFLIFKEVWDFAVNLRFYKQEQKNKALLDSLTIRAEIHKKVEEGILTKKEAMEYLHIVKTRTDDLIGMKVLPKQLTIESNVLENKNILSSITELKMLSSKNDV